MSYEVAYNKKLKPMFDDYTYKVLYGGRCSGKTIFVANYCLDKCFRNKNVLYIEPYTIVNPHSLEFLFRDVLYHNHLNNFTIRHDMIECDGAYIKSLNIGNIKSLLQQRYDRYICNYDIIWVEDAQHITKADLALLLLIIRKSGDEIIFTYNPIKTTTPIHEKFITTKTPPQNALAININYYDNLFLPLYVKPIIQHDKINDRSRYEHIWLGKPMEDRNK